MASPYKRRKVSLLHNFWIYRRLVGLAMVLGLLLWFIWANNNAVTVAFPFGLGKFNSTTSVVIILSALVGSFVTALTITLVYAFKKGKFSLSREIDESDSYLADDLPPADYASRASDAPTDKPWS